MADYCHRIHDQRHQPAADLPLRSLADQSERRHHSARSTAVFGRRVRPRRSSAAVQSAGRYFRNKVGRYRCGNCQRLVLYGRVFRRGEPGLHHGPLWAPVLPGADGGHFLFGRGRNPFREAVIWRRLGKVEKRKNMLKRVMTVDIIKAW